MKGVILAGGLGTRLRPLTLVTNKHLLPIYDRPMIHYPIQTLLNAGIRDILIVTGGEHAGDFLKLLGNGKSLGVRDLHYTYQEGEGGIADALKLAEDFIDGGKVVVNDSISTTPEATKAALNAYQGQRIALIAGGHERHQDYTELASLLAPAGVTVLVCLPVTGDRLATATFTAAPEIQVLEAADLRAAMQALAGRTDTYDTVILSPGAPSYGQRESADKEFRNFEERGQAFVAGAGVYIGGSKALVALARELFED